MRQVLNNDQVSRVIPAPPEVLWPLVADPRRMPELSPYLSRVEWLDGATEAAVGARFKAWNTDRGRGKWHNSPVFIVVEPHREIAWQRTERIAGTLEWRYRFSPVDGGTEVTESYEVVKPISPVGWFVIGTLLRNTDVAGWLRTGMIETLERMERVATAAESVS